MKNLKNVFSLIVTTLTAISLFSQAGKHGAISITQQNLVINEYTALTADAQIGDEVIQVQSSNLNSNNRFPTPLEPGDLIMIIQMQGATTQNTLSANGLFAEPNNSTQGFIFDYQNSGNYEFAVVTQVINPTSIRISCGLMLNYTASGHAQVIRVPRYTNMEVNANASVTCDPWNGDIGGVLVAEVRDTTTIEGTLDASERGFRGGILSDNNSGYGTQYYTSPMNNRGAEKGESIIGFHFEYDNLYNGRYCKGAIANGGGGASNHNAGGGGGGNAGDLSLWNGKGNPDISDPNWIIAWELEEVGLSTNVSSGGGRGGYTQSGDNLDPLTVPPGDVSWAGDYRRINGGLGGRPLDYSTGKIFLGGGGGAGEQNDNDAGAGGNGGGIVYLITKGEVLGNGTIQSNGQRGENSDNPAPWNSQGGKDGCGGGGAGGTIIFRAEEDIPSTLTLRANGGNGGDQILTAGAFYFGPTTQAEGPGGGGGGGYIAITQGNPAREALGGANGTTNSESLVDFIPNGATRGGDGLPMETFVSPFPGVSVDDVAICPGNSATFVVNISGDPNLVSIEWYADAGLTDLIGTGTSYTSDILFEQTTFYVLACPGGLIPVTAIIGTIDAGVTQDFISICEGTSTTIEAYGGETYFWYPDTYLSQNNIADPVASPPSSGYIYVDISAQGCTLTDSVYIDVSTELMVQTSLDTMICFGSSVQLDAFAEDADSYSWTPTENMDNSSISNPTVSPEQTTTYEVTVTAGVCNGTGQITVTVANELVVNITPGDTTVCINDPIDFQAEASGGFGTYDYLWSQGSTGSSFQYYFTEDYVLSVEVTDDMGCTASHSIQVLTLPPADVQLDDLTVCLGESVTLNPEFSGGLGSGTIAWEINGDVVSNDLSHSFTPNETTTVCVTYDAGCSLFATSCALVEVTETPELNVQVSAESICVGSSFVLSSEVVSGATPDSFTWFINGNSFEGQSVSVMMNSSGSFDIDLIVSYNASCSFSFNSISGITVVDIPTALFTASPNPVTINNPEVNFENNSVGGSDYFWEFSDYGTSEEENPTFIFPESTGEYPVILTVSNTLGCEDTYTLVIEVIEEMVVPNIFSPNGDGVNDLFVISGLPNNTSLKIFNRWGNLVYRSDAYQNNWNGDSQSEGTYFYLLELSNGENKEGSVTIVR
jgi:gliding motility-associated-like protein